MLTGKGMLSSNISKLLIGLTLFAFSCTDNNLAKPATATSWFDSTAFPAQPFYSVTLFTLDSLKKMTITTDSGTFTDHHIAEYVGKAGYSFVNKSGIPKTTGYTSYELDTSKIRQLQTFLAKQPCTGSLFTDKSCAPEFRNVFVFMT
ncbi:hypothetical protein [Paraflavitalea speifideaquila]|uniref:hypothetical protein n=1 Tax=Paraflavitalea speifideaquila TaxID=3076558 RepID=UPI0028F0F74F|nr:hypothetical protein [Paraflavitalea speifideiaquila]